MLFKKVVGSITCTYRFAVLMVLVVLVVVLPFDRVHSWTTNVNNNRRNADTSSRSKKRLFISSGRQQLNARPPRKSSANYDGSPYSHHYSQQIRRRRQVLQQIALGIVSAGAGIPVTTAQAGEVGAKINKAVTQSDLGISVRRSVVRGAQEFDKFDGQWEQFSDRFGLGTNRAKQPGRPEPKIIPDPQPLDLKLAGHVLDILDDTFCTCSKITPNDLQRQIRIVRETVLPSFERSGLTFASPGVIETGPQFNFATYARFKAYSDLIIDRRIDFRPFKVAFEERMGQQLLTLLIPDYKAPSKSLSKSSSSLTAAERRLALNQSVDLVDRISKILVEKGLIARIDLAPLESDITEDWSQDLADLSWSVALDGDITLQSQLLLQEQGFRLYPNFGRYAIQLVLRDTLLDQEVTTEDYYMDTDYNSDPDKFEVKEVLVNISIEST